ncbi:hypothetical protein [Fibrella forsythiae]|uniref:Uncharacterized protein n=1 Tax=Fibrella forsythiae TaxID=2817061 RepID=A0ABS3JAG7_9BACT|nr:hypothetical protein [Fibrella forsythiae]MBO0946988.1 hypothetical protein [Fibrella forsythiae]
METNQLPPPSATDDLDNLLNQPTSYIAPPPVATVDGQEPPPPVDSPSMDPGDFDLEVDQDPVSTDPGAEPTKNRAFFRRQATQFVKTFNVAQKTVLSSVVYPKTILEPGDKQLVADYRVKYKTRSKSNKLEIPAEGDELYDALRRYEQLDQAISELPLSAEEQADLIAPLTDVLEKHQQKALTPEWALVVAVFLVMLPRLEPVFPKLFSSLTK